MNAAVTLLPLLGTAATLVNRGGSFRYASGTSGLVEGMTPSALATAGAGVGAAVGFGAGNTVRGAGAGAVGRAHAAKSEVTVPLRARRSMARRLAMRASSRQSIRPSNRRSARSYPQLQVRAAGFEYLDHSVMGLQTRLLGHHVS